jgi:hypothetical protein
MRLRIVFLALAAAIPALPQTAPQPMLDTGVPNFYSPSPPPLITGASSTNPLLVPAPSNLKPSGALPPAGSGPCSGDGALHTNSAVQQRAGKRQRK